MLAAEGRNYVEQGWWALRFAPALDVTPPADGQWDFYMHHPAGLPLLVSASFAVFGVSEWAARLLAIAASLLAIPVLWAFTRRLHGARAALVAAALAAVLPVTAYYGSLVDDVGPVLTLFLTAAFALYARLLDRPAGPTFGALLAALAAAGAINWQGVEVAGVLGLHAWWTGSRRRAAALFGVALALPALHLAHVAWAMGSVAADGSTGNLLHAFLFRSLGGAEKLGGLQATLGLLGLRLLRLYTVPVLLLALYALLRRRLGRRPGLTLLAIGFAVVDIAVFLEGATRHDYWLTTLVPGLLPVAAAGLGDLAGLVARGRPARATALLLFGTLAVGGWGALRTQQLWALAGGERSRDVGEFVRARFRPGDLVFTCEEATPAIRYYARRELRGGIDDRTLRLLARDPTLRRGVYFMLLQRPVHEHEHAELQALLSEHYHDRPGRLPDGSVVHVYNLGRPRAEALAPR